MNTHRFIQPSISILPSQVMKAVDACLLAMVFLVTAPRIFLDSQLVLWRARWDGCNTADPGTWCYAAICRLFRGYLTLFRLQCEVTGNLDLPAGPKILAANHPNASDMFFLPGILNERLYLVAQGNLFDLPILGGLLSRAGQIPVWPDRRGLAFEQACNRLRQGGTILIFPEGRLNPTRNAVRSGTGAVRMSLATGAPIIPIGTHAADRNTLHLKYHSKTGVHTGRWQVRGCCTMQFGEPWFPAGEIFPDEGQPPSRFLTEKLMEKIYTLAHAAGGE